MNPTLLTPLRKCAVALIAICASIVPASMSAQPAAPALQSYDVELVIFRTLTSNASPEEWQMEAADASQQQLTIPADEDTPPTASSAVPAPEATSFPALSPAKLKLTSVVDTLRRSRNYQPLAHIGWTQPGYPRDTAHYLPIDALVPPTAGVTGQIALTRGRYLHLTLDLAYIAPGDTGEPGQRFTLRQTRRMRSNERHYLDHPRFGVIAVITPTQE
jgi:hypothetical protein